MYDNVFAKFLSFPYWPVKITSIEGSGANVEFSDGSTSGTGGRVPMSRILPFKKESAQKIFNSTKFKPGKNSAVEFKKACAQFGLKIK